MAPAVATLHKRWRPPASVPKRGERHALDSDPHAVGTLHDAAQASATAHQLWDLTPDGGQSMHDGLTPLSRPWTNHIAAADDRAERQARDATEAAHRPTAPDREYLTMGEASRILHISRGKLIRAIECGWLRAMRHSGNDSWRYFTYDDLMAYAGRLCLPPDRLQQIHEQTMRALARVTQEADV